jgi:hypothetical protein
MVIEMVIDVRRRRSSSGLRHRRRHSLVDELRHQCAGRAPATLLALPDAAAMLAQ